jgi:ribonuclease HI
MIELFFCGVGIICCGRPRVRTCFIFKRNGRIVLQGVKTSQKNIESNNNSAQYYGLIEALLFLKRLNIKENVLIYNDNVILCNIISKAWGWNRRKTIWTPHKKCSYLNRLLQESLKYLKDINYRIVLVPKRKNLTTHLLLISLLEERSIIYPRLFIDKKEWKIKKWKRKLSLRNKKLARSAIWLYS